MHGERLAVVLGEVCRIPERPINAPKRMPSRELLSLGIIEAPGLEHQNFVGDNMWYSCSIVVNMGRRHVPRLVTQ